MKYNDALIIWERKFSNRTVVTDLLGYTIKKESFDDDSDYSWTVFSVQDSLHPLHTDIDFQICDDQSGKVLNINDLEYEYKIIDSLYVKIDEKYIDILECVNLN